MSDFRRISAVLIGLAGCGAIAWAQPPAEPEAVLHKTKARTVHDVREIPFELVGGKIYIDTMVNGEGPYPFVLDTASPPTIIDTDLAKKLGLRTTRMGSVGGAGEGSTPASGVEDVTLEFGGITIESPAMMGVAINRRLRGFSGHDVMGLIGNDWVSKNVVEIDYAHALVRVYDPEWEYTGDGTIVPTRIRSYTFVKGSITPPGPKGDDGEEPKPIDMTFAVDTGAGLSVAINTAPVNRYHLLDLKTPMVESIVGYGLGGEVKHHVARMGRVALGDAFVDRPWVTLSQDKGGALGGRNFDGIIGAEVLSKYTVIFDGPRKRMILEKNADYAKPMEWDMSGMVLSGDGDDGRLRVMHLVEGAAAEKAGVKLSDVLLSVDGKPVMATDRDKVRVLMRKDGAERTLELKRGEETVTVKMALKRQV